MPISNFYPARSRFFLQWKYGPIFTDLKASSLWRFIFISPASGLLIREILIVSANASHRDAVMQGGITTESVSAQN
jgi:hypothetical protein